MKGNVIGKTIRGLLYMAILAGGVLAFLAAANRLPSLLRQDFARQYATIEEARRAIGFDTMPVPAYFPEGLSWPPSFIFAQNKPYKAVVLEFRDSKAMETVLTVVQSSLKGGDAQLQRNKMVEIKEETQYWLKGRNARLQVGICGNRASCCTMTWQDNGLYYTVLFMSSPFELIRIAESMVR